MDSCMFEKMGGLREGFESVVSAALATECLAKDCILVAKAQVKEKESTIFGSRAWADVVKIPPDKN
ncbi:hypothetical protein KI387_026712, partial [Taxus chinensis]